MRADFEAKLTSLANAITAADFCFDQRRKRFIYIPTGEPWVISSVRIFCTAEQMEAMKQGS